jgi:hypothetical protein
MFVQTRNPTCSNNFFAGEAMMQKTNRDSSMKNIEQSVVAETNTLLQIRLRSRLAKAQEITISCHENEVPPFVEAEMDLLYQHLNSSLSHMGVSRKAKGASTYVVRKGGQPITILLFTRKNRRVSVINEMIRLSPEEIVRFVDYIFGTYKSIGAISFSLIQKEMLRLPYPYQRFNASEDIVLTLPATPEAYLDSLSYKTRRNIRHYLKTLKRDFPSFCFRIYEKAEISARHIVDIVNLSRRRIGAKNLKFVLGDEEIDWMIQLAQVRGMVGIATIDGKVCAGFISFRIGANYFGQMIGHDIQYNQYSLGILCCYLTLCEQIVRGGKEAHLCWGRYGYKYKLAGVQRDMACLDVYRTNTQYFLSAGVIVKNAVQTAIKRFKVKMLDIEREQDAQVGIVGRLVKALRKVKRFRLAS